jgi:SprT protein
MILNEEKLKETQRKIKEVVDKLNQKFDFKMPYPCFAFDVTGTTAGLAKSATMSVHFNTKLALNQWSDFLENTVPHEVCHIAVWYWTRFFGAGRQPPHGARWKSMMRLVGCVPKRTHDYDVSEVKKKTKKYVYHCGCVKPIEVSSIIHNKIQKGFIYSCKRCHQKLTGGQLKISDRMAQFFSS